MAGAGGVGAAHGRAAARSGVSSGHDMTNCFKVVCVFYTWSAS